MKIEVSFNNHLKNCVCLKCHTARVLLDIIRNDKKRTIVKETI